MVREIARARLRLSLRPVPFAVSDFVLATLPDESYDPGTVLPRMAMLLYAVYTTTNQARHHVRPTREEAKGMLEQALLQAVMGHARGRRLVDDLWRQRAR